MMKTKLFLVLLVIVTTFFNKTHARTRAHVTNPVGLSGNSTATAATNNDSRKSAPCTNIVNIPDANFKAALLDHGYGIIGREISKIDTDGDGEICESEALAYTGAISITNGNISNSTGIEAFTELTKLYLGSNNLTNLDVSKNTKLTVLSCPSNQLTSLDVSNNTGLTELNFYNNQLKSIDISNNTGLERLMSNSNQLTSLDTGNNTALSYLGCRNNQLTSLNIANGNNTNMFFMDAVNNNLTCIQTDANIIGTTPNGWTKDATGSYSVNCGNTCTNIVNIPDANLKAVLVGNTNINTDGDSEICESEAQAYTGTLFFLGQNIADATGLEAFTQATELLLYDNPLLTNLDLSNNTALTNIVITNTPLTSLDVSNNTALKILSCIGTSLTSLDVSNNTALKELSCISNNLTSLNVNGATALTSLSCSDNQLTSLDVSGATALTNLNCYKNQLTSLNVNGATALTNLMCYNNQLTSLNVNGATALTNLMCAENQLTSLDVSDATALTNLNCYKNQLTSLDVSNNTGLESLYCDSNQLTSLDTGNNTALLFLSCENNQLTSLNVANGNNNNLEVIAGNNSNLTCIQTDANIVGTNPANWSKDTTASYSVNCSSACTNIVNIPDANFKAALLAQGNSITGVGISTIDIDGDGEICESEALAYTGAISVSNQNVSNLTGIEAFTELTKLYLGNNNVTSLDVSKNTKLTILYFPENQLTNLDVSNNTALTELNCNLNNLTSLDVSNNTALTKLVCSNNDLTALDVSNNTALTYFHCFNNNLTSLDVHQHSALNELACNNNQLTSLNIANGNNINLARMYATNNSSLTCIKTDTNIINAIPTNWRKDATASYDANCWDPITSVTITNTEERIKAYEELQMTATVQPSGANPGIVWSVNNTSIAATITTDGKLKSTQSGVVTVTATSIADNTIVATKQIKVAPACAIFFPDSNFETALLNHGVSITSHTFMDGTTRTIPKIDTNNDGYICDSEAIAFTGVIYIRNTNNIGSITDTSGIEYFTNATGLAAGSQAFTSLDVSANTQLKELSCEFNPNLTSLKLGTNSNLKYLRVFQTNIVNFDVSTVQNLVVLSMSVIPNIGSLDLSNHKKLVDLLCSENDLTSLNIANGENSNLGTLLADRNPNLSCIQVDANIVNSIPNGWTKDATASYRDDCLTPVCTSFVNIPDANFKAILLANSSINTNGDNEICDTEAANYTGGINVNNKNISDLTGIEAFKNIYSLDCSQNKLTSLNVSQNTKLTYLGCGTNQLTDIDVSNNRFLEYFYCAENQITSLDVSQNSYLTGLQCYDNSLTSLNIANGFNSYLSSMSALNNNLTCIQTDTGFTAPSSWVKDATASYSDNCAATTTVPVTGITVAGSDISTNGGTTTMTATVLPNNATNSAVTWSVDDTSIATIDATTGTLTAVSNGDVVVTATAKDGSGVTGTKTITVSGQACTNIVNIPDANFKAALLDHGDSITGVGISTIDTDGDGEICESEAQAYTGTISITNGNISNSTGIEAFTELTKLYLGGNNLTNLDVSKNTKLTILSCPSNQLTSLDVSNNTGLTELNFYNNQLKSIDVSNNTGLEWLMSNSNQLTSLDTGNNTALSYLSCRNNNLTSLNIANGNNTNMFFMDAVSNNLTCIQTDANIIGTTPNGWTKDATASYSDNCGATTVPVTGITVAGSDISTNGGTTTMTVTVLPTNATNSAVTWSVDDTSIATIDATTGTLTAVSNGDVVVTATAKDGSGVTGTKTITVSGQGSTCTNIVNIPDANFKAALLDHGGSITGVGISTIDTDGDGEICESEAQAYTGTIGVSDKNIIDLTGIEAFTKITKLYFGNNNVTSVDVSKNTALTLLYCRRSKLKNLDVSNNTALTELNCSENNLTSLNVSNNAALQKLECFRNNLTSLDISSATALTELYCYTNQITSLDVSKNTALTKSECSNNQITSLDVSNNIALTKLECSNNEITSLDISNNTALVNFGCIGNQLTSLNVANGNNTNMTRINSSYNSNLKCIQTDANIVGTNPTGWSKDATASYSANCGATTTVPVTGITVAGSDITTNNGTVQMNATVVPTNATNNAVTWSVDDTSIATINATTGALTAVSNGDVVVKATAKDGSGVTGTKTITISGQGTITTVPVTGITVTGSNITTNDGTTQMNATVAPTNATNNAVTWSVDDTSIATINATTGVLTAVSNGDVVVTATAKDSSGVTGTKTITVSGQGTATTVLVTGVTVTGSNITTNDGTAQMNTTVVPTNATNSAVTWSVDDTSIATIDATTGVLTAVSNGDVVVTATAKDGSGVTGTKTITVSGQDTAVTVTEITVAGTDITIKGGTTQMNTTVVPTNATNSAVTWSVDDTSIATIDATTGTLTAVSNGDVVVTATAKDGSGVTGTKTITVSGQDTATTIPVTGITVAGSDITIKGGTTQMNATVTPTNATNSTVTWSVDDTSIATIDATTGTLTAISNGDIIVTARAKDGSTIIGTATITISGQDTPTIAGDTNGNGIIDNNEVAGDTDGNGIIDNDEVAGDTDGNGIIDNDEVAGDTDGNGIIDNDEVGIGINNQVKLPKGFSPNNDGINDTWVINITTNQPIGVKIFNRWGHLVYKATDYNNDFDGKSNVISTSDKLPVGSYFYVVTYTQKGKNKVAKNWIYINY